MSHPSARLFQQIVSDTRQLTRQYLRQAQGDATASPRIRELTQALSLKQALLEGCGDDTEPSK